MAKAPVRGRAPVVTNGTAVKMPRKRLTVGANLTEQEPFLAQVEVDEYMDGEYGEQIHLAVRPLEFQVAQDKTGQFHEWYKPSTRTASKCGALLAALKEIGIDESVAVGEGELVGTVAYFIRRTIEFGKNKDGEVLKAEDCLLPSGPATEADLARAKAKGASTAKAPTPSAPDWSDEQIAAVIGLIAGKKQAQFQIAAARSKMAPDLKNAILSGEAVKYLLELDLIEISGAGVVISKLDEGDDSDDTTEAEDDEDPEGAADEDEAGEEEETKEEVPAF